MYHENNHSAFRGKWRLDPMLVDPTSDFRMKVTGCACFDLFREDEDDFRDDLGQSCMFVAQRF